jgi:hypothetical protein
MYNSVAVFVCAWPPFLDRSLGKLHPLAQATNLGGHSLYQRIGNDCEVVPGALTRSMRERAKGFELVFDDYPDRMDYARDIAQDC